MLKRASDGQNWEVKYGKMRGQTCKRTSYNTIQGTHTLGGTPFRGNYARVGDHYNETLDAFIPPKPFDSWVLNETTFVYDPPTPFLTEDSQDLHIDGMNPRLLGLESNN